MVIICSQSFQDGTIGHTAHAKYLRKKVLIFLFSRNRLRKKNKYKLIMYKEILSKLISFYRNSLHRSNSVTMNGRETQNHSLGEPKIKELMFILYTGIK